MRLGRDPARDADVRMSFAQQPGTAADRWDVGRVTIDVLPDVALLEIFDCYCYVNQVPEEEKDEEEEDLGIQAWQTLVHVCWKWRSVVFGSPLRLNLRLHGTEFTPLRETLAVWPALPIVVCLVNPLERRGINIDNITAALEHNDRVCEIRLSQVTRSHLEEV